jgi:signal peptidase II
MKFVSKIKYFWIALVIILLDQLTKHLVTSAFILGHSYPVFPYFQLTLLYNSGGVFGLFSQASGWQNFLFAGFAIIVCIILIRMLWKMSDGERYFAVAANLILGGAISNLLDRLLYGHVVDFLDFHIGELHWAPFNFADSAIVIGAILLLLNFKLWKKPT